MAGATVSGGGRGVHWRGGERWRGGLGGGVECARDGGTARGGIGAGVGVGVARRAVAHAGARTVEVDGAGPAVSDGAGDWVAGRAWGRGGEEIEDDQLMCPICPRYDPDMPRSVSPTGRVQYVQQTCWRGRNIPTLNPRLTGEGGEIASRAGDAVCGSGSIGDGGGNREGVVLGVSVPRVGVGVESLGAERTPGGWGV